MRNTNSSTAFATAMQQSEERHQLRLQIHRLQGELAAEREECDRLRGERDELQRQLETELHRQTLDARENAGFFDVAVRQARETWMKS